MFDLIKKTSSALWNALKSLFPSAAGEGLNIQWGKVNNTTYSLQLPGGDRVEIGDHDSPTFKPTLHLERWDNECFCKVGLLVSDAEVAAASFIVESNAILWEGPHMAIRSFGLPADGSQLELGGVELEIILPQPPIDNSVKLAIETRNLVFYYQPALTPEEIVAGDYRPEDVVGSYAVYHATKANNKYKTGKAFHIYRPKAIDALGGETWGTLDITSGVMTISFDPAWLQSAAYPVLVDPTFGNTGIGGTEAATAGDQLQGTHSRTPGEAGTLDSISYYSRKAGVSQLTKGALYLVSDNTKVTETAEVLVNSAVAQWWVSAGAAEALAAINYYVCFGFNASGGDEISYYWDAVPAANRIGANIVYPVFPSPSAPINSTRKNSIFATYTAAVGAAQWGAGPAPLVGKPVTV